MSRTIRVVATTLALWGCSSTSSPSPSAPSEDGGRVDAAVDAATSSLSAGDYCETIADFFCAFYMRCERMAAATADECRTVFLETCNERFEPRDVALANAGLLELSRAGVAACKTHLESVACEEQTLDLQGPCSKMWIGSSPAGAPCAIDVESFVCAPGTTCILGLDFCGTCQTAVAAGETCGDGIRCQAEAACIAGRCVTRGVVGAECDDARPCVTGARCTAGRCEGPTVVGEGDACDSTHRCPYRTSCVASRCERSSLIGESCDAKRECASGRCVSGTCVALAADGESCAQPSQCRSGSCAKGKCAPLPSACFAK